MLKTIGSWLSYVAKAAYRDHLKDVMKPHKEETRKLSDSVVELRATVDANKDLILAIAKEIAAEQAKQTTRDEFERQVREYSRRQKKLPPVA